MTATLREGHITVKAAIYTALMGAVGMIFTLIAIPVAPGTHLNLYVFSGIIVGASCGILLGAIAGIIGQLYTPILWGHPWCFILTGPVGALIGWLCTKLGLRPLISTEIAYWTLGLVCNWLVLNVFLGLPWAYTWLIGFWIVGADYTLAAILVEALLTVPSVRRRVPKVPISGPDFVKRSSILPNPLWVVD